MNDIAGQRGSGTCCILCGLESEDVEVRLTHLPHVDPVERALCVPCHNTVEWRHTPRTKAEFRRRAPYGYRREGEELVQEPIEFAGLERILELWRAGYNARAIAFILQLEEHPTRRGGTWRASTVYRIIAQEAPSSPKGIRQQISSLRYGYKKDGEETVPDDTEQRVIRWIVEQYKDGASRTEIAEELNSRKVPTKTGKEWAAVTVANVLEWEGF